MTHTFDIGVTKVRALHEFGLGRRFKRRRDVGVPTRSTTRLDSTNRLDSTLCARPMFRRAAASLVSTASSSSTTTLRRPSEVLLSATTTPNGIAARSASTLCVRRRFDASSRDVCRHLHRRRATTIRTTSLSTIERTIDRSIDRSIQLRNTERVTDST